MKKILLSFLVIILTRLFINADTGSLEIKLPVTYQESLIRIGIDPYSISENGRIAAAFLWKALNKNDMESVKKAILLYEELIQTDPNIIDYGALKWLLECIVASKEERENLISGQLDEDFYKYWSDNNYANLKEYILREFKIEEFKPDDIKTHLERRAYLKDLMMYNNPRRNDWEKSEEIIRHLNLKQGDKVLDIGCGFGFYSYRFSNILGKTGKVWAIDIGETYINYMDKFVKKYKIDNIVPVHSKVSDISVREPADVAFMCSVYHVIYGWLQQADRAQFISSIKRSLKQGGMLFIADNSFDNGNELNSCYLKKELVIAQLAFYGFRFIKNVQIAPQRYLLIFKHEPGQTAPILTDVGGQAIDFVSDKEKITDKTPRLNITSGNSLIYLLRPEGHDVTEKGIEAAKLVYQALSGKDLNAAKKAVELYANIIPVENFRGENSAFQWLAEYLAAPQEIQAKMLENPHTRAYYNYLAKDDFKELKDYMNFQYRLNQPNQENKKQENKKQTNKDNKTDSADPQFFEEFFLLNNPRREELENTGRIMEILDLKPGKTIGDIQSRSGYYACKFSQFVGERGKVYAIDFHNGHRNFVENFVREQKIKNIQVIQSKMDDISLKEKVDYLFMSSLYHLIYGIGSEPERSGFIMSIKKALKKNGRLIIVDNSPVESGYYNYYIDKELIIAQLFYFGFVLDKYVQINPYQYMLTFKLN